MNHKVSSVQTLHDDAMALYNNVVVGSADTSADTLINNLYNGIQVLKGCWEGKDAGVQIQNVVGVHNALVGIRNALGQLAADSSKIASNYREIQNANGAGMEALNVVHSDSKTVLDAYSDNRDTISITPEAQNGKARIDAANNSMDGFISEVSRYYHSIMDNWTVGTGRENAINAFDSFIANSNRYKETLASVSSSIATALQNYTF